MTPWAAAAFTRAGDGVGFGVVGETVVFTVVATVTGGGVIPDNASKTASRLKRVLSRACWKRVFKLASART